jgi:steroid delta-isomerase-like uncharacterized protein
MALDGLKLISAYTQALANKDADGIRNLCSSEQVLDLVYFDAEGRRPLSVEESRMFWSAWFTAFPDDYDFEVTRTVAAKEVVVMQWVFRGTFAGILGPPVSVRPVSPTGKTIMFRAVSIYDLANGQIQRETIYLDLATWFVEMGFEP